MRRFLSILLVLMLLAPAALAERGQRATLTISDMKLYDGETLAMDLSKLGLILDTASNAQGSAITAALTAGENRYDLQATFQGGQSFLTSSLLKETYVLRSAEHSPFAVGIGVIEAADPAGIIAKLFGQLDAELDKATYEAQAPGATYKAWRVLEQTAQTHDTFVMSDVSLDGFLGGDESDAVYDIKGDRYFTPASAQTGDDVTFYEFTLTQTPISGGMGRTWPIQYYCFSGEYGGGRDLTVFEKELYYSFYTSEYPDEIQGFEMGTAKDDKPIATIERTKLLYNDEGTPGAFEAWELIVGDQWEPDVQVDLNSFHDDAGQVHQVELTYVVQSNAMSALSGSLSLPAGSVAMPPMSGQLFYDGKIEQNGTDGSREAGLITWTDQTSSLTAQCTYETVAAEDGAVNSDYGKPVVEVDNMTDTQAMALEQQLMTAFMRVAGAMIQAAPDLSAVVAAMISGPK